MSKEVPGAAVERPRPARIFSDFAEILKGTQFEDKGSRSSTRSVEVPAGNLAYKVSHTNFLGGRGGFERLTTLAVTVEDPEADEVLRFSYLQKDATLVINGSVIEAKDEQSWQKFEEVLADVKAAQAAGTKDEA